jgi:hypothetical protein
MKNVVLLVLQIGLFWLCWYPTTGRSYVSQTPKLHKIFRFTILSIDSITLILQLIFINNYNAYKIIIFVYLLAATTVLNIIDSVGKRKYYELLKQRIQIVQKDSPVKNFKEMQAVLVEKFDQLYQISDIQKVYTDF